MTGNSPAEFTIAPPIVPLTPCSCGKGELFRKWYGPTSICVECVVCGKLSPVSTGCETMREAKAEAHKLWNKMMKEEVIEP